MIAIECRHRDTGEMMEATLVDSEQALSVLAKSEWADGAVAIMKYGKSGIRKPYIAGRGAYGQVLNIPSWIVKDSAGRFGVMAPDDFAASYHTMRTRMGVR